MDAVVVVAGVAEAAEVEVRVRARSQTGGPTSPSMRIIPRIQSVKNIMFLGKVLIGVKSQLHVHGKTSLYQKINNETGASLDLKTYKKPCIPDLKQKYTR